MIDPGFVRLDDSYYRRIHQLNGSGPNRTLIHDVERVTPQTVLAERAVNLSGHPGVVSDDLPVADQIAITGDTRMSFEDLDEDRLGDIYLVNGSYYTVVVTDERVIDHGLAALRYKVPRYLLVSIGVVLIGWGLFISMRERF